jgi:hypothetical protein
MFLKDAIHPKENYGTYSAPDQSLSIHAAVSEEHSREIKESISFPGTWDKSFGPGETMPIL